MPKNCRHFWGGFESKSRGGIFGRLLRIRGGGDKMVFAFVSCLDKARKRDG